MLWQESAILRTCWVSAFLLARLFPPVRVWLSPFFRHLTLLLPSTSTSFLIFITPFRNSSSLSTQYLAFLPREGPVFVDSMALFASLFESIPCPLDNLNSKIDSVIHSLMSSAAKNSINI